MKEKQIRVGLPLTVYVDRVIFYDAQNHMASNGDDLRDQMYIMYGIMLYREDQLLGGQE